MDRRILLPLIAASVFGMSQRQPAAAQKLNLNTNQGNPDSKTSPKTQQLPVLSIDGNSEPPAEIFRNSTDLKSVADSIHFDRHRPTRKRSINPLQYFEPPSLPSSIKVPVQHFR